MFFPMLVLCSISSAISLSNQEDLSINNYTQIGCVKIPLAKQSIINEIHTNFLSPYQTFSSPSMTIELCFRLCRRWFILLSNNEKNCLCLYTIDQSYEINQYLGEYLSTKNCSSTDVQVYSLTEQISMLPSITTAINDDWSLDGCYFLQGIQHVPVNLYLNEFDYLQANDLCRKHCQDYDEKNFYSYFLSRKKSCYCSPLKFSQTVKTIALRKPLVHCSFHPYICQGFFNSCEKLFLETSPDTLMKINVRHYCSSNSNQSLIFDRIFYRCFNSIILQTPKNFTVIHEREKCSPLLIETIEQWQYFSQSSWITYSKLAFAIDGNSTYIFEDLFRGRNVTRWTRNACLLIYRMKSNEITYDLFRCTDLRLSGSILCAQKPLQAVNSSEEDFQITTNQSLSIDHDEDFSCPSNFVLFDRTCYYIDRTFLYNTSSAERLCYEKNSNSTLVKFDSHQWGNINTTKFLGRMYNDLLLEFFYYLLEKKFLEQIIDESNRKNWLRLLLGDKNDPNECVLRYFARASGTFTVFQRCNTGGHPVCQSEPIRMKIISDQTYSSIKIETTTVVITTTSLCESCTTNTPAGEYLLNNQTIINRISVNGTVNATNTTQTKDKHSAYRSLIVILTGPGLALLIFLVGIALLIRYLRQNHLPQSRRSSIVDIRRTKRSSTIVTVGDTPTTPAVLPTYLRLPRVSFSESDMLLPIDNSLLSNGEAIELLPANKPHVINVDNRISENEDETPTATNE